MDRSVVKTQHSAGLSLAQKGLLLLALPLCFQLVLISVLYYFHDRAEQYAIRAGNARDLSSALSRFSTRAYSCIYRIDEGLWHHQQTSPLALDNIQKLAQEADDLKASLQKAAHQRDYKMPQDVVQQSTVAIDETVNAIVNMARLNNVAAGTTSDTPEHKQAFQGLQDNSHVAANVITRIGELGYGKIKIGPEYWARQRQQWVTIVVIGTIFNIIIVLMLGLFFSRDIVSRVIIMLDNSFRLANQQRLHPQIRGSDEIALLDHAFHSMAEALSQALSKQRSLIENARDVICSLDGKDNFVAVSSASTTVFGYTPEELMGASVLNLIPDDDAKEVIERLRQVRETEEPDCFEVRLIKRDRTVVDLLWSASWEPTEEAMFCVVHDITERKGAERLRQEVMQMVSHDLRSPLNTVQGFHEFLATGRLGTLSDQGHNMLAAAERNTNRMLGLINDLLEIEKMESGVLDLTIAEVSVASVFEQSVQSVVALANTKGVQVEVVPTALGCNADGDRLVQVLVNLLSNAIKFTPAGAKVTLSAALSGNYLEMKVADQGRGIPANMLPTIFDRFKQVQASDAKGKRGFGLGLAICKALVELHNGVINVESEVGVGSTFIVRIPSDGPSGASATTRDR
ncbi:MAG TPA: ATP-binding protein, partial [Candidatus Obscuribacterales bacterium]